MPTHHESGSTCAISSVESFIDAGSKDGCCAQDIVPTAASAIIIFFSINQKFLLDINIVVPWFGKADGYRNLVAGQGA